MLISETLRPILPDHVVPLAKWLSPDEETTCQQARVGLSRGTAAVALATPQTMARAGKVQSLTVSHAKRDTHGDGMKRCFYVEIAGSPCLFEKTVVAGGEHKSCSSYVDSGHPVADEKSRGGWFWHLGGLRSLLRCCQLKKSTAVQNVAFLTHQLKSPGWCGTCRTIMHLCDFLLSTN
jgi:hypothetical protein